MHLVALWLAGGSACLTVAQALSPANPFLAAAGGWAEMQVYRVDSEIHMHDVEHVNPDGILGTRYLNVSGCTGNPNPVPLWTTSSRIVSEGWAAVAGSSTKPLIALQFPVLDIGRKQHCADRHQS